MFAPARGGMTGAMARPREFDVEQALEAATHAFWARGYEATSLADLMRAMGLQKGSIYRAFGDKHALFVSALQRYLDQTYEAQCAILVKAPSPRAAIQAWLDQLIETVPAEGGSCRGCLAVNTLIELGPHDEKARAVLEAHFDRVRRVVAGEIRRGQEQGEFRRDLDAETLAHIVVTVIAGLLGRLKGSMTKADALRLARATLRLMA
jgi:TetR/AcrR family transcriptional repressor of nem operon